MMKLITGIFPQMWHGVFGTGGSWSRSVYQLLAKIIASSEYFKKSNVENSNKLQRLNLRSTKNLDKKMNNAARGSIEFESLLYRFSNFKYQVLHVGTK